MVDVPRYLRPILFTLLVGLVLAGLYLVGRPYYHVNDRRWMAGIEERAERIRNLVLGNSHGRSLRLTTMVLPGENISAGGQDLFELEYKLSVLAPELPRLRRVFIAISYHSFFFDNGAYERRGRKTRAGLRLETYVRFPSTFGYIEGDSRVYLKSLLHPLITPDHWERVLTGGEREKLTKPGAGSRLRPFKLAAARRQARRHKGQHTERRLRKIARKECRFMASLVRNMRRSNPGVVSESFAALERAAERLMDDGVEVIFFTPPYYEAYNECSPPGWKKLARASTRRLQRRLGIRYHDLSGDPEISGNHNLFFDANHVNGVGARLYSLKLRAWMRAEKLRHRGKGRRDGRGDAVQ